MSLDGAQNQWNLQSITRSTPCRDYTAVIVRLPDCGSEDNCVSVIEVNTVCPPFGLSLSQRHTYCCEACCLASSNVLVSSVMTRILQYAKRQ